MNTWLWTSLCLKGPFKTVMRVCALFLLVSLAGVSGAGAHAQAIVVPEVETVSPTGSPESCCHELGSEAPVATCAAAPCCPALANANLAGVSCMAEDDGAVRPLGCVMTGGLSNLPLLHPPIFS